jgi:hypothetical protein
MAYKMKGPTFFNKKSPIKQKTEDVKINWETLENVYVDGKPANEVIADNKAQIEKEREEKRKQQEADWERQKNDPNFRPRI